MANQMGQTFTGGQQQTQKQHPQSTTPPPIPPQISFHVVIEGKQAGPFSIETLKKMVLQNEFSKRMLVWREGMSNWITAEQIPELEGAFKSVPPPIPEN